MEKNNINELIKKDSYANFWDVTWIAIEPGYARLSLVVQEKMLNFLGYIHGGLVFSLADIAFAAASNMDSSPSLALNISGNFLRTAKVGDTIEAVAERVHSTKRTGLYKMEVLCGDQMLAQFHGTVFRKVK